LLNDKIAAVDIIFSLLLVMGALTGLSWSAFSVPPKHSLRLVDQGLWVLLAGLVGGRAAFVSLNWGYFQVFPSEIFQVWLGGLSGLGAVFGFVGGICLVAWLYAESPLELADRLLPLGISLAAAGWLAAWWGGSAYGAQVDAWYAVPARAENGLWSSRFPTQLLGSLFTLALWAVLNRLVRPGSIPGFKAGLGLLGVGLILFGLSFTRVDPLPLWRGLRLDTWAALGLVGSAFLVLLVTGACIFARRAPKAGK
jgi:prolipoprotein diacylglyceryltransferase